MAQLRDEADVLLSRSAEVQDGQAALVADMAKELLQPAALPRFHGSLSIERAASRGRAGTVALRPSAGSAEHILQRSEHRHFLSLALVLMRAGGNWRGCRCRLRHCRLGLLSRLVLCRFG